MRFLPYLIAFLSIILLLSCAGRKRGKDIDFTKYVNPLIGTDWVGNTYPGATVPFGMVQLSPDNGKSGWDYIAGYYYPDTMIAGFSHTHLSGTGAVTSMTFALCQSAKVLRMKSSLRTTYGPHSATKTKKPNPDIMP